MNKRQYCDSGKLANARVVTLSMNGVFQPNDNEQNKTKKKSVTKRNDINVFE